MKAGRKGECDLGWDQDCWEGRFSALLLEVWSGWGVAVLKNTIIIYQFILSTKHCSKCFKYTKVFLPCFCRWANWVTVKSSMLLKARRLGRGWASIWNQAGWRERSSSCHQLLSVEDQTGRLRSCCRLGQAGRGVAGQWDGKTERI